MNVPTQSAWQMRGLFGFRSLNLHESVGITQNRFDVSRGVSNLTFQGATVSAPSSLEIFDGFRTSNQFYGAQFGGRLSRDSGRFNMGLLAKVGLGATRQTVNIEGNTNLLTPGNRPVSAPGGLLAQTTNIGHYSRDVFTVVPEVNFNLGYRLTDGAMIRVGYSILYWSSVTRPGDAIDRSLNPALINADRRYGGAPGPNRPSFDFGSSDFWAHGLNLGLEFRY